MYLQACFAALVNALFYTINTKGPSFAKRRALSPTVTVIIIIGVIAVGGVAIYFLVASGGPTTTTYP